MVENSSEEFNCSMPLNGSVSEYTNCMDNQPQLTNDFAKKYTCYESWDSIEHQQYYTVFNLFAVYLIPVFILSNLVKIKYAFN